MKKRLNYLRKYLKINQDTFGKKIGITGAAISRLESGQRELTDSTIKLISLKFGVNEEWLRDGVGEMFDESEDSFSMLMGSIASGDPYKKAVISVMGKWSDDTWKAFEKFIDDVTEEVKKIDKKDKECL